jgi:serine/threonine-protein kinase 24/25/MST4
MASALLSHKFIEKCKGTASSMLPQIEKARRIRAEMAAQAANYAQEQGTASSGGQFSTWEKGQTVKMHDTSAGTMLVRDTVVKAFSETSLDEATGTVRGPVSTGSTLLSTPTSKPSSDTTDQETDQLRSLTPESTADLKKHGAGLTLEPLTPYASSSPAFSPMPNQPLGVHSFVSRRSHSSMEAALGPGTPVGGGTRPGFGIQDKLLSVYAAGNTVPIPFLKATDLSPIALTFDRIFTDGRSDRSGNVAMEAIQDLYVSEGPVRRGRKVFNEMPLPASVHQRAATSTTLPNLARALAYHKRCYEELPSQGCQAAQEQQIIHNLSDTLRTILRL